MSGFAPSAVKVDALLFDKDGTLFDFHATWGVWAFGLLVDITKGDADRIRQLAEVMKYDLATQSFLPESTMIAETNRECAATMARALPEMTLDEIEDYMNRHAANAPLAPAVPLEPLLTSLIQRGVRLGVMTNDAEVSARAHLNGAGVFDFFEFVAGFDSGHGAKPAPDPLLAFARTVDVAPDRVAMVGDSTHDLLAGRAAGMQTIGVLTGLAEADELAPLADVVLPDIGHIPDWLTV